MKNQSIPELLEKAQKVFNAWIRNRDKDKGCISCGGPVENAGHYFSAGHYSALRLNEMNVNGQCIRCNKHLHGNLINYRKGLIDRYGAEKVELLEASVQLRKVTKWDRYTLELIIKTYKL